jgi:DNA-binding NarL/FixJ family response regulator
MVEVRIVLTEATSSIRVALVGGLTLNHDATRALLDREGFEVPVNGSADIVLVDQDDAPPIRDIRAQYAEARVLVVTARMDHESSAQLVRDGAHGIVSKARTGDHLIAAIRKVHAGRDVGRPRGRRRRSWPTCSVPAAATTPTVRASRRSPRASATS